MGRARALSLQSESPRSWESPPQPAAGDAGAAAPRRGGDYVELDEQWESAIVFSGDGRSPGPEGDMGMSAPDFSMLVIAALASVAAGIAYAVLTRENPGFLAAKVLSSLSAIGFGSLGVIWGSTTSAYPLGWRIAAASLLGAIAAGSLAWVFADINSQFKRPTPPTPGSTPQAQRADAAPTVIPEPRPIPDTSPHQNHPRTVQTQDKLPPTPTTDDSVHVGKDNFGNACSGQAHCEQGSPPVPPGSLPHF